MGLPNDENDDENDGGENDADAAAAADIHYCRY